MFIFKGILQTGGHIYKLMIIGGVLAWRRFGNPAQIHPLKCTQSKAKDLIDLFPEGAAIAFHSLISTCRNLLHRGNGAVGRCRLEHFSCKSAAEHELYPISSMHLILIRLSGLCAYLP